MRLTVTSFAAAIVISGCATFEPQAIAPTATAAAYEARTLDNPELRTFIQKNTQRQLDTWPPSQWDLEFLMLAAFYYHADLDIARAKWDVAQAGVVTAGMRPNPTINANAQRSANPPSGTPPWTFGLNLDIPIQTAGKRGYRIEQASHLSEAARLGIAGTAWQVRSRVRNALLDLSIAQQTSDALLEQRRLQQENVALLERRLGLGMASTPEVTQARIALDQSTIALSDAERLQADARARLAGALGLSVKALDGIVIASDVFRQPPTLPTDKVREQALVNRADVLGALAEYAASQSALQLEIANQYPDLHLGPGYTFDQGQKKWSLGLSLVLPLLNQNQGPIAEAKARRSQALATFNATQARAIGEIETALTGYRASREKLIAIDALLASQTDQLSKARSSFRAGETDRVALVGSQLEATQIALSRVDAIGKTRQALSALEDAVQAPLGEPSSAPLNAPGPLTDALQQNPRPTKEDTQ